MTTLHQQKHIHLSKLKGNFYKKKNATRFKCYSCGTSREFHAFLNDHFPSLFLHYVAERESYGLTGFQTNCPTLKTATKNPQSIIRSKSYSIDTQYPRSEVSQP